MVSKEEYDKLLEVINQQKEQIDKLKTQQMKPRGFGDYIAQGMFYANVPKDQFSHQFMMIHKPPKEIKRFDDLLSSEILLGNIEDQRTMLLAQRDFYYLNRFYDMGVRSKGVMSLFISLYYPWKGQMRMTSIMEGRERDLQSFLIPEEPATGFKLPFFKKKKKTQGKRRITDYMTPQQEEMTYE